MPPKKAAAAYTKTGGKDGKGRVVYVSAKGVERVRCRSAATGKAEWRKPAAASARGGDRGDHEEEFETAMDNNQHAQLTAALQLMNTNIKDLDERSKSVKYMSDTIVNKVIERSDNLAKKMDSGDADLRGVRDKVALINKNIEGMRIKIKKSIRSADFAYF